MCGRWTQRTFGEKVLVIILLTLILFIFGFKRHNAILIMHLDYEHFICNANLMNEQWLLSTARCASYMKVTKPSWSQYLPVWYIKAGSTAWNKNGILRPVLKYVIHPDYNDETLESNISLIKIARKFDSFTIDTIKSIIASPVQMVDRPLIFFTEGWGKLGYDGFYHDSVLKRMKVEMVQKNECVSIWKGVNKISAHDQCLRVVKPNGSCTPGDGSLLTFGSSVIGMNSWGETCGFEDVPQVYTMLLPYKKWIDLVLE